jgi:hypothetical protein
MPVRLDGQELILAVTHSRPGGETFLKVHTSVDAALRDWGSSTRCSPIYGLNQSSWPAPEQPFHIWFVGPVFPGDVPSGFGAFLSLGIFNLLLLACTAEEKRRVQTFISKLNDVPWESWGVSATGVVTSTDYASCLKVASKRPPEALLTLRA